jgi:hypothetical protein
MEENIYRLPESPTKVYADFGPWYRAEWRRLRHEAWTLICIGWFRFWFLRK